MDIPATLQPYIELLPLALTAMISALLLTPLIGHFARKYGFVDLPAVLRKRTDDSIDTRIHTDVKPRLGGFAVIIPVLILALFNVSLSKEIVGLLIGIVIVAISGAIDEHKDTELSSSKQFLFQFLGALMIVLSGSSILSIQIVGMNLDFDLFSHGFQIGSFLYTFVFPADFLTILWIMAIMNALKWVFGLDSLGEMTTFIACITLTLLSVKFGNYNLALITALAAGGLLGYLPYSLYPAKIFSGAAAQNVYGLLLATLSIIGGGKITTSILLLSIPILDMIWVIIYRLRKYPELPFYKRPMARGRVHLHHRLMEMGFGVKQTVLIESLAMSIISIVAFYFSGFSAKSLAILVVVALVLTGFLLITVLSKRRAARALTIRESEPEPPTTISEEQSPEDRYAY